MSSPRRAQTPAPRAVAPDEPFDRVSSPAGPDDPSIGAPASPRTIAADPLPEELDLRAQAPASAQLVFFVDAHALAPKRGELTVEWPLTPGAHRIWVESGGRKSEPARVQVDAE